MHINFDNLHSLNHFLKNHVNSLRELGSASAQTITDLIQTMRQNEALLTGKENEPKDLVKFLKRVISIRNLTKDAQGFTDDGDLEKVTRAASSFFTHLGSHNILEVFNTIKKLEKVDPVLYLQTLADWIAEEKIHTDQLNLNTNEWLAVAPHLTFLHIRNWEFRRMDSEEAMGNLLEKTEKLTELQITYCHRIGNAFDRFTKADQLVTLKVRDCSYFSHPLPQDMVRLERLHVKNCAFFEQPLPQGMSALKELTYPESDAFSKKDIILFLLSIYRTDEPRGVRLGKKLNIDEAQLSFYELFVSRYPDRLDDILAWVDELAFAEPDVVEGWDVELVISFIKDDMLKNDPHQQILILSLLAESFKPDTPQVLEFLRSLITTPMDKPLLQFYEKMTAVRNDFTELTAVTLLLVDIDREKKLRYLPHLLSRDRAGEVQAVFRNIQNLERTGHFDLLNQSFTADCVRYVLGVENLFTENSDHNLNTMQQIADDAKEFYNYYNTRQEALFPSFLKDANAYFGTAVGQVVLKTYLHNIVKVPQLQEAALRALPPNNKKTIALYPKKISSDVNLTLKVKVVPTLPVADSVELISVLASRFKLRNFTRIEVTYYGTPAIDASGPGRQLFAEVIQGAVVNNRSKFTLTAGGGMAPYDPKHLRATRNVHPIYGYCGLFFSLALHCKYPIGKVLNEKVISCLCSIPKASLDARDFDVAKFLSAMNPANLIRYMRESTIEDEDLVKLYENILLSSDENEILQATQKLNDILEDAKLEELIHFGAANILQIQECVRDIFIEGVSHYIYAVYGMARGMNKRLPDSIGEYKIRDWEDVQRLGAAELSRHLQGELTAQHIKEHLRIKIIGEATPEKMTTGQNVKLWTEQWIDQNSENAEFLANFVQAFSGGRALTREIRFDIDPNVHQVKLHTCFNSADIPINITEAWLNAVLDEFGAGDLRFDID